MRQARHCRKRRREGHSMPRRLEPKLSILPAAQREIWPSLAPSGGLRFVLCGGTAVALQLGHRESLDFDFFCSAPLDKEEVRSQFGFVNGAAILQDAPPSQSERDRSSDPARGPGSRARVA
ncbi:nucleotidyl transferase AbiEii/AbiGii toxin family protein [Bradyrhizobium sp. 186]|nr:nucleotidyl transferase AbiEii/AbiGii toxin family protein [Bradyrhizobium sp. 186]